jgi:Tol biopolymer transport system component
MAPEQAKGKPVDKRVDIWAFGCVLYEMLTGKRPFGGEDVTDTLAAIVRADPDWSALPVDTPPAVRTVLRRCLEKDRRERLPDIGAARLELKDALKDALKDGRSAAPAAPARVQARRAILPWALFALASLAAVAAAGYAAFMRPPADPRVFKSVVGAPRELSGAPALRLAISPDGLRVAFSAPDASGDTMLWVRSLDNHVAQPLPGTAHGTAPFWSPDSRSIAFIADGKLRRIDASGGPVITLCDATTAPAGAWNRDDVILFSGLRGPLWRVSASGGTPEVVTELNPARGGERIHILPSFLPDGRHFIYTAGAGGSRAIGLFIGSLDSKQTEPLLAAAAHGMYANGYLLFLRDSTLMAQRFDPKTRQLSGEAKPVATDLQINPATGTGAFSASQSGVLVYQSGPAAGTLLVWRDRSGKQLETLGTQAANRDVQLSPDGTRASVTTPPNASAQPDVYIFELDRGGLRKRFTFGGGEDAVWTPDGRRIAFAARRKKALDLFLKNANGDGGEETLLEDSVDKYPLGFTPDGRFLLYYLTTGAASGHVWMLPMSGPRTPRPFNHTKYSETPSEISPDGRWAAYVSDESGRREIYVTSFPDASGKWQVSTSGGDNPRWRRDGKEMFFTSGDRFYVVDVDTTGAQFDSGVVQPLFEVRVPAATLGTRSTFAVSKDGQRFLFNMWDPQAASAPISLFVNWPATLKQ